MSWRQPARSGQAEMLYAAAQAESEQHPERYSLSVENVLARATRNGRSDPVAFAEGWAEGLESYLASAQEDGRLNAVGRRMVIESAAARLAAGARLATHFADHPRKATAPLIPPIVIVGGWRTGTTFLFRLLASDPRLRALLPVELAEPWRMAGLNGDERELRIDASRRAHELLHLLNPQLRAVHDSGPRLPEECVLAMGTDLRNWGFTASIRLDGYARWLATQSFGGSYRRYRQVLQCLDDQDGRRFLLKAPAHVAELKHLVDAFPGAVVVHLHRDIVETIASGASLFAVFRSTYSDAVDPLDVGRFQTEQTELWLRRASAFQSSPASAAAIFLDLDYRELLADPAGVASRIYRAAAMEPPPDLPRRIVDYHASNPRHAHGTHTYSPADFGLDADELRARFTFLPF